MSINNKINKLRAETGISQILPKDISNQLDNLEVELKSLNEKLKSAIIVKDQVIYYEEVCEVLDLISYVNNFKIHQ